MHARTVTDSADQHYLLKVLANFVSLWFFSCFSNQMKILYKDKKSKNIFRNFFECATAPAAVCVVSSQKELTGCVRSHQSFKILKDFMLTVNYNLVKVI